MKARGGDKQHILIDLDTFLDTRLAAVAEISQEAAIKLISNKDYYFREVNDFKVMCGVDKETFDAQFAKRNVETLKHSLPTSCHPLIRTMIADLIEQQKNTPYAAEVGMSLNVYPYELSKPELTVLAETVCMATGLPAEQVEIVRIAWADLTPVVVKARYSGMILYNFSEWLRSQVDNLLTTTMPGIVILAPALYYDHPPVGDECTFEKGEHLSVFDLNEGFLAGCFDLHFISSSYFSTVPPTAVRPRPVPPPPPPTT